MNLKKYSITIVFLLFALVCIKANDSTLQLSFSKKYEGNFKSFEIDNFGNYYLITPNNQIIKLNSKFDSVAYFSGAKYLGNINSIDVSNPLKILVLYKGFSTIVVLDRLLAPLNTISLQKQNMFDVSGVTSSFDNNIWLFDEIENKIKKIDFSGKVLSESIDFRQLFKYNKNFACQFVKDVEGKLYLYSSLFGLFIFDYYGALNKRISITGLQQTQLLNTALIGIFDNHFLRYDMNTKTEKKQYPNEVAILSSKIIFYKSQLFALNKIGLWVYDY
jgi:hypothetical protein